jgi:hypothetical protein
MDAIVASNSSATDDKSITPTPGWRLRETGGSLVAGIAALYL